MQHILSTSGWDVRHVHIFLVDTWCAACRAAVSPSYHVQALFAQHAGAWSVPTSIEANAASMVAVSTTCADADCKKLDCKVCALRGC